MSSTPIELIQPVSPHAIAAGLGLMDRRDLCGMLALLEVTSAIEIARGAVDLVQRTVGREIPSMASRLKERAEVLWKGDLPDDALRHKLWTEVTTALGNPNLLPLSTRKVREASAATAVRAAEVLSPSLVQSAAGVGDDHVGLFEKAAKRIGKALKNPTSAFSTPPVMSFPDIVAREAFSLIEALQGAKEAGLLDPSVAQGLEAGQDAAMKAAVAGGGWAAFATLVQFSGFAPYILAAQASAFIPFIGGPAAVSFLAVLVNPVTLIAGLAALGYWGVAHQSKEVQKLAASRVAAMLAIAGIGRETEGIASLVSTFRRLVDHGSIALSHLSEKEAALVREKVARLNSRLGRGLPPAMASTTMPWSAPVDLPQKSMDVDVPLVGGLTMADLIYHAVSIDPQVIRAADFSRSLDIDGPIALASYIGSFVSDGARTNLRGYTAEQLVAAHFVEAGSAVEIPQTSNMPGYDLLVDGNPVQVKCGVDIALLKEHFERYPDIPVVANSDLVAEIGKLEPQFQHLVNTFAGFDLSAVQEVLDHSLMGAEGLSDADIPFFAMLVGTGKGVYRAWQGEISLEELPAWLVVDLMVRGALTTGGKIAGSFVGLIVLGPAGAIVVAPVAGVLALMAVGKAKGEMDRLLMREWHESVLQEANTLHKATQHALERRVHALFCRVSSFQESRSQLPFELLSFLDARAFDDALFAVECLEELSAPSQIQDIPELLVRIERLALLDGTVSQSKARLLVALERKPSLATGVEETAHKIWVAVQTRTPRD